MSGRGAYYKEKYGGGRGRGGGGSRGVGGRGGGHGTGEANNYSTGRGDHGDYCARVYNNNAMSASSAPYASPAAPSSSSVGHSKSSTKMDLIHALRRIDNKSYPCYKDLLGSWSFDEKFNGVSFSFELIVDHVQG